MGAALEFFSGLPVRVIQDIIVSILGSTVIVLIASGVGTIRSGKNYVSEIRGQLGNIFSPSSARGVVSSFAFLFSSAYKLIVLFVSAVIIPASVILYYSLYFEPEDGPMSTGVLILFLLTIMVILMIGPVRRFTNRTGFYLMFTPLYALVLGGLTYFLAAFIASLFFGGVGHSGGANAALDAPIQSTNAKILLAVMLAIATYFAFRLWRWTQQWLRQIGVLS
ncbi:MAG: hypothetical protein GC131_04505 [Alphaproteobacteria bacterium]|nr:hypothetical protein [Alphaproteobacteria bacterium]